MLDEWKSPYIFYNPSTGNYGGYYGQEVEDNARAFAALSRQVE